MNETKTISRSFILSIEKKGISTIRIEIHKYQFESSFLQCSFLKKKGDESAKGEKREEQWRDFAKVGGNLSAIIS